MQTDEFLTDTMDWLSLRWFDWHLLRSYHWDHPYFLYALPAIPVLFWLRHVLHRKEKQYYTVSFIHKSRLTDWVTLLRFVTPVFLGLGVFFVVLALARPQTVTTKADRFSEGIDITLLLDISDSMMEKDLLPNRLAAAQSVARQFIAGRLQNRIGLVIFAGEAYSLCPLTTDYELLNQFLNDVKPSMIPEAGTAIGSALAVAINRMRDSKSESKVIILISDGDNTSGNLDPYTMARIAYAYGIRIYTIAVGRITPRLPSDSLAPPQTAAVAENELRRIASEGNGHYYAATDNKALANVFAEINQLEKVKFRDTSFKEIRDYYRVYLYWGILFLIVSLGAKCTFMTNILED